MQDFQTRTFYHHNILCLETYHSNTDYILANSISTMKKTITGPFGLITLLIAADFITDCLAAPARGAPKLVRRKRNKQEKASPLLSAPRQNNEHDVPCNLDVSVGCTVLGDGMASPEDCESFILPALSLEPCQQAPFRTTLLFNGGDCKAGSDADDGLPFTCQDGELASPPINDDEESYIEVTDAQNQGVVYHQGWVTVGTEYVLDAGDQMPMETGFIIEIFDSQDKSNLLQRVVYTNSLCQSELELLKIFGASQIINYTNKAQGFVSPFAHYSYQVMVHVSIAVKEPADSVTLKRLSLLTDFSGNLNLDDAVRDQSVTLDEPVTVSLPVQTIDLTESRAYSVLAQAIVLDSEATADKCEDVSFHKFYTGGYKLA